MKVKLSWTAAMSGKRINAMAIAILTLVCFMLAGASYFFEDTSAGGSRFYLRNSGGAVVFEHGKHIENAESCADCHHDLLSVTEMPGCADCHDDDFAAEDFTHRELNEVEAHRCSFCHPVNEEKQPQSCRSCHPGMQEASVTSVSCMECHDDSYTKDLLSHDEMQEIEDHSCEGCHRAQSLSDSYHRQCSGCHLRENENQFSAADGRAKCAACHLK